MPHPVVDRSIACGTWHVGGARQWYAARTTAPSGRLAPQVADHTALADKAAATDDARRDGELPSPTSSESVTMSTTTSPPMAQAEEESRSASPLDHDDDERRAEVESATESTTPKSTVEETIRHLLKEMLHIHRIDILLLEQFEHIEQSLLQVSCHTVNDPDGRAVHLNNSNSWLCK